MPTRRRDPLIRGFDDTNIRQFLAIQLAADHLSGQGQRRENGAVSNAITLMAQAVDCVLGHRS